MTISLAILSGTMAARADIATIGCVSCARMCNHRLHDIETSDRRDAGDARRPHPRIPTARSTGSTPGPTASSSCRRSTPSSSAAACSPTTSGSGRPSSTIRPPPRRCSAAIRTRASSTTRASPPRPRTSCSHDARRTTWPTARIVRDIDELRALRQQPGKPVYVVGGPGLVAGLIDARLLDELRLIVHPVALGGGRALFARRHALELVARHRWRAAASASPTGSMRPADFDAAVIGEFRARGGRVGGSLADTPLLLLGTTGARTGRPRTTPLAYRREADRLYVIASAGGAPAHPAWYLNLRAHPVCHRGGRDGAVRGDRDRAGGRGPRPRVRRHRRRQPGGGRVPGDDRAHDPGRRPRPEARG